MDKPGFDLIAIGASAGGVMAIRQILSALAPDFQIPIVIVQHLPATSRIDVNLIYGSGSGLVPARRVFEAEDKMKIEQRGIYMAAPGFHLLVERGGTIALSQDELIKHSRPSIDVLFETVARAYGSRAVGVLLTGANSDGADGLFAIHKAGGTTLVQDPESAVSRYMPTAALALFQPTWVANLDGLAAQLNQFARESAETAV